MNRRESLAAFAGVAAALAGCSGYGSATSESTATRGAEGEIDTDAPGTGSATDPEMVRVREATDRAPLWLADRDGETDRERGSHRERRRHSRTVVDTPARAERLRVADGVDADGLDSFLSETDLDGQTLYLESVEVRACFELALCRIEWQPDEVSTDYARTQLPYDTRCEVDDHVFEARLVRIPASLSADEVRGYGSSIGTAGCQRRNRAAAEGGGGSSTGSDGETRPATATSTGGDR
ncbi:hypothetical protein [Halomicrobium katesii]|uniref:hypothetical protein n=1 Tax=Halomicrobium katesii TaxID=437163 RepID=UPI00037546B6|nr:hypothetical protein [Halomicrobium katesii]